ncbi:MAG: hypothetical protein RJS98_04265 [Rhodospirillaceae bacterium]
MPVIAAATMVSAIGSLYGVAGDINDFIDKHISSLKQNEDETIAITGNVLGGVKTGFGMGYLGSVTLMSTGQLLLGNPLNAIATVGTAATLTNPVAMTAASIGAVYFGWNALTTAQKDSILDKLAEGLEVGVEFIKSVIRFAVGLMKELLNSKQVKQLKKYIKVQAALFGRSLYDVTHQLRDFCSTTAENIGRKASAVRQATSATSRKAYTAAKGTWDGVKGRVPRIRKRDKTGSDIEEI